VLQALVRDINFGVLGVAVTVTRPWPDDVPIATKGIWLTPGLAHPALDPLPGDQAIRRRERLRVIAIPVSDVPTLPTGSRIDAPDVEGATPAAWRVDALDYADGWHRRVIVVAETEP
jgi:hypothetical protein